MNKKHTFFTKPWSYEVVARGDGWALFWPRAKWLRLSKEERAKVIARQRKLMERRQKQEQKKAAQKKARKHVEAA